MKSQSHSSLILLSASHGINHLYQLLAPLIITKVKEEYALSYFDSGILYACFILSYSLLQIFFGYLSIRVGRKKIIMLGFILSSISFLIIGFVNNVLLFGLLLFLAGSGGSTYHPNGMPLLSVYYKEKRGQAAGFHQTGGSLGSFIGPLFAGLVLFSLNWKLSLILLSIPGFTLSIILWLCLKESPIKYEEKRNVQQAIGESNDNKFNTSSIRAGLKYARPAFLFLITAVIYNIGTRGIDSFAPQYFQYGRGIENIFEVSFLFSMLKIAGLFSGPFSGRLSDIFGRKRVLYALIIIAAASLYFLTLVPTNLLILPCIIFGFSSFGLLTITDAFLSDLSPNGYISTIFGLHFTISFAVGAFISPIFGLIADCCGFNLGFKILSLIIPFSIPLLIRVKSNAQS